MLTMFVSSCAKMILLVVVSLLIIACNAQNLEPNNKCLYTSGKNVFTCTGLNKVDQTIDRFLTTNTHLFILKNCRTVNFASNHHNTPNFKNIISYDILDNGNLEISQFAFNGLSNVHYMKINGNNLPKLVTNNFGGLYNLELLNLAKNNITVFERGTFNNLTKLITLDITENKLREIPQNAFGGLASLEALFLERNEIKQISPTAFSGLTQLQTLDLTHNSIEQLDSNTFNHLTNLESLYLGFNKIERIAGELKLAKMSFLQLDTNQLTSINDETLRSSQYVKSISLANNRLSGLGQKPFQQLLALKHLDLRHNGVDGTKFETLKKTVNVVF